MSILSDIYMDACIYDPDDWEINLEWKSSLTLSEQLLFPNNIDTLLSIEQQYQSIQQHLQQEPVFLNEPPKSPKHQIRYHDCMWSGRCIAHQDKTKCPSSFVCGGGNGTNANRIQNKNNANQINNRNAQNNNCYIQNINNFNKNSNNCHISSLPLTIGQKHNKIQTQNGAIPTTGMLIKSSTQHIPAGTSLLLKSRLNQQQQHKRQQQQQQQQQQQCKIKIPAVTTSEFLKDREQQQQQQQQQTQYQQNHNQILNNSIIARPDTPLSLDDDATEFKHIVDLSACVMGSNHMSLDIIPKAKIISMLKEHLEDSTLEVCGGMPSLYSPNPQYGNGGFMKSFNVGCDGDGGGGGGGGGIRPSLSSESLTDALSVLKSLSDCKDKDDDDEDEDSAFEIDSDSESSNNTSCSTRSIRYSSSSGISSAVSSTGSTVNGDAGTNAGGHHTATTHSDHSYTRNKNRVDVIGLGVQTPSDSEEEIDVVSIHDKTLPTNPSARDRRALQTTVAHKISARIVKTSKGLKTIPARRRCSEESYNSNVTSSVKPSPSGFGSNTVTADCSASSLTSGGVVGGRGTTSNAATTYPSSTSTGRYSTNSRKRNYMSISANNTSTTSNPSSSKRHRGKKQRTPSKRQNSDSDEADTIEKRNLHNDMERQRRIGLKNLFEELKRQIPSISDKERAPKVNILREAADLCRKLNKEQEEMNSLKLEQEMLLARVKALRTTLATKRANCTE